MMDEEFHGVYGNASGATKTAWMLTFADLLSLMLTFFVLLYAMSQITHAQWEKVARSLQQRLNPDRIIMEISFSEDHTITRKEAPAAANLDYIYTILSDKFGKASTSREITLRRLDDRVVVSLASDLLFSPGQAELQPSGENTLRLVSDAVGALNNKLTINGHTDPTPINTKEFPSNRELSLARAHKIAERLYASGYLFAIEAYGLADSRYDEINAYGKEKERLARRVDIEVRPVMP